jgi:2-phospho-L-lactate guanylyltransferase
MGELRRLQTGTSRVLAQLPQREPTLAGMINTVDFLDTPKWCAILPIKGGAKAKSRLGSDAEVAELANEFANRTLAALLACIEVERVVIVTTDETWHNLATDRVTTVADPGAGLNAAICAVRDVEFETQLLFVVPGDLPLLDPIELTEVLIRARKYPRAFVRDKDGSGTTLLTALTAIDLVPLYGEGSAAAHLENGAVELEAGLSVRYDVDTQADLEYVNRVHK